MSVPSFRQFIRSRAVSSTTKVRLNGYTAKLQGSPDTLTPKGVYALVQEQPTENPDGTDATLAFKAKTVTLDGTDDTDADNAADTYNALPSDVCEYLSLRYPGCDGTTPAKKPRKDRGGVDSAVTNGTTAS